MSTKNWVFVCSDKDALRPDLGNRRFMVDPHLMIANEANIRATKTTAMGMQTLGRMTRNSAFGKLAQSPNNITGRAVSQVIVDEWALKPVQPPRLTRIAASIKLALLK